MKKYLCIQNSKLEKSLVFLVVWERLANNQNRIVIFNVENNRCLVDYLINIDSIMATEKFIKDNYYNDFNNQKLLKVD